MDQQGGPDTKRPRLGAGPPSSWASGSAHHSVLPNPAPPQAPPPPPHHPTPIYQPSHPFSRPSEPAPPPSAPPPPPPPTSSAQHFDDRRHHESEPYPPMQEHRQPPASPAHPSYPPYVRDPVVVKRDPSDDTLPQLRRPLSTGNNVPEPLPVAPHGLPPQSHLEDRRHPSFDGGPPPPPPPPGPMYRTPSYPPPTPLPQPTHYDHPMYGPPPVADPIYPITYSTTGKRKAQRASQACDSCRSLKAKCDETKPCKNCREKGMECKYRDPIPKQQDKVAADILDGINFLRSELTSGLTSFSNRMTKLETALKQINPNADLDMVPLHAEPTPRLFHDMESTPHHGGDDGDSTPSPPDEMHMSTDVTQGPPPPASVPEPMVSLDEAHRTVRQMQNDDEMEVEPGLVVPPGEPAMPINHTTLAGLLLTWPAIRDRVQHLLDQEGIRYPHEYPIRQEEQRGLLRLFGRGEGHDRKPADGKDASGDLGTIGGSYVPDNADDISDIASPSPGDVWGQTGGLSPPAAVDLKGTPLRPNGDLDLDPERVWQYVASYEKNIQNMHPLIIPKELRSMVKVFLDRIPPSSKQQKSANVAKFITSQMPMAPEPLVEAGMKRKRSPATDVSDPVTQPQKPGKPYRNIDTALILVVLALGKICLHKDRKLPDVVPESDSAVHQSPQLRNGHPPSPNQRSPPSYTTQSQSSGQPSPKISDDRTLSSRRQSFQSPHPTSVKAGYTLKRNLDNIPGLEYFAIATDIIGNHIGGKELKHVWVSILASLYFGQLGRPLQSLEHIAMAGRTLQSLLRPHLDRYGKLRAAIEPLSRKRDNQYVIAFWTCLQLESDILAELPLPPSGILAYEQQMPYPNDRLAAEYGFPEDVLQSYHGQLYLRNRLNEIHKNLYDARRPAQDAPSYAKRETIEILVQSLDDIRWMPRSFEFNESDPPASDILAARLRAKYWGARVITFRPFIKMVLDFNTRSQQQRVHEPSGLGTGDFRSDFAPQIHPEARSAGDIDPKIIEYAERGMRALIESTRAFHGIKDKRFIVTNVFGTAHAQWGNLLILDAVRRDPTLGPRLDEGMLRELFDKTIDFFEIVSQPSSSLIHDMNILKGLRRDWDMIRRVEMDRAASSSFSSATTGPPPPLTPGPVPPHSMHAPATPVDATFAPPPLQQQLPYTNSIRRQSGTEP